VALRAYPNAMVSRPLDTRYLAQKRRAHLSGCRYRGSNGKGIVRKPVASVLYPSMHYRYGVAMKRSANTAKTAAPMEMRAALKRMLRNAAMSSIGYSEQ
jgi:hypothetical protein